MDSFFFSSLFFVQNTIFKVDYTEEEGDVTTGRPSRRLPLPESTIIMEIGDDVGGKKVKDVVVKCYGDIRTLMYWPDNSRFEVFEDSMKFDVNGISAYGTRQSGFRLGAYDPSEGGCG